jgi:hypothetical protein
MVYTCMSEAVCQNVLLGKLACYILHGDVYSLPSLLDVPEIALGVAYLSAKDSTQQCTMTGAVAETHVL